ncbi:sesquipedalian-1 isoform 1-T2 [Polymixia lowei]
MKIHKKMLTHYLSCTSPVDKEGYLYKKRERNGSYRRRWFVLKGNLLFYQERPADRRLLGVVVLEGCTVRRCEAEGQFAFCLVFQGPGLKTYTFAAEDSQTQESWVKVLVSAGHCYLSLLVRDLGKQYEEAKLEQGSSASGPSGRGLDQSIIPVNPGSLVPAQGPQTAVRQGPQTAGRQGRSFSDSHVLQAPSVPTKVTSKKSPKLWPKRNAHVTPLNGPAPLYGEWPLVGLDPLEEFSKLHEYYGQEVMQVRKEWLKSQRVEEDHCDEDLIDLG